MSHLDPERLALVAVGETLTDAEQQHLATCDACSLELAELEHTVAVGRSTMTLGELETPPDRVWDRAVGPMQFIPGTWRRHARDGDGDEVADPHNLYDAALSAARYLCAGGVMEGEGNLRAGFLRYNHSGAYVERVLTLAYGYAAAAPAVPPLPPLPSPG